MLIYITGTSGSGKSTVGKVLKNRGFETYDVDEDGFAAHYNKETGQKVEKTSHSKAWNDEHAWMISRDMVEGLAKKPNKSKVFLCGVASNDVEVFDLFDLIIALSVDDETTRQRLGGRADRDFGKSEDELHLVLNWNQYAEREYRSYGATIIDAMRPIDHVVDDVLAATEKTLEE